MAYPYSIGVNNNDQIVGSNYYYYPSGESHSRGFVKLGPVEDPSYVNLAGNPRSYIVSINNHGVAVGHWYERSPNGNQTLHAFVWENGQITDLNPLIGASWSQAADINDRGQIVGTAVFGPPVDQPEYEGHAFLYETNGGGITDLGVLSGLSTSAAAALNEFGQVVGLSADWNAHPYVMRPFLYTDGSLNELTGEQGAGFDINELGHVVGAKELGFSSNKQNHPFVWRDGDVEPIPLNGSPQAINNADQVVGDAWTPAFRDYAFLFQGGHVTDLDTLAAGLLLPGATITSARDINDKGHMLVEVLFQGLGFILLLEPDVEDLLKKVKRLVTLMVQILFGVTQDGGGLVLRGKVPVPIGPWGPLSIEQWEMTFERCSELLGDLVEDQSELEKAHQELRRVIDEGIAGRG